MSTNPILERRSIRKFKPTPVERELIEKLLEAADAAPSACNKRPLEFFAVTNEEKLGEISRAGIFTRMKAPLVIVVSGKGNTSACLASSYMELMAERLGLGVHYSGFFVAAAKLNPKIGSMLKLEKG